MIVTRLPTRPHSWRLAPLLFAVAVGACSSPPPPHQTDGGTSKSDASSSDAVMGASGGSGGSGTGGSGGGSGGGDPNPGGGGGGSGGSGGCGSYLGTAGMCDPLKQNCPSGSKCIAGCTNMGPIAACQPDTSTGMQDDPCTGPTGCAKGYYCAAMTATDMHCKKYCAGDCDCPAGKTCTKLMGMCPGGTPLRLALCN